ncbi:MAG: PEP-CTERM sorting domain-containing protein [Nitrospiria bacterium]
MKINRTVRFRMFWGVGGLVVLVALIVSLMPLKVGTKPFQSNRPGRVSGLFSNPPSPPSMITQETEQNPSARNIEHQQAVSVVGFEHAENDAGRHDGIAIAQESGPENEQTVQGGNENPEAYEDHPPQQLASAVNGFNRFPSSGGGHRAMPHGNRLSTDSSAPSSNSCCSSRPLQAGLPDGSNNSGGDGAGPSSGGGQPSVSSAPIPSMPGVPVVGSSPCCGPGDQGVPADFPALFPADGQNPPFDGRPSNSIPPLFFAPAETDYPDHPETRDPRAIPEPATALLMGTGLFGLLVSRRKRRR